MSQLALNYSIMDYTLAPQPILKTQQSLPYLSFALSCLCMCVHNYIYVCMVGDEEWQNNFHKCTVFEGQGVFVGNKLLIPLSILSSVTGF